MPTVRVPGPLGLTNTSGQLHQSAHPAGFGASSVGGGTEYEEFVAKVLAAAIRDRFRKGRRRFPDLAAGELSPVEKGKVMRPEAAASCLRLLIRARDDLALDQMGPPADLEAKKREDAARLVKSIGIGSAYRNYEQETFIWRNQCFPTYYKDTASARHALAGGPHGDAAVAYLVDYFSGRKAPPGFSNHSDGRAVDFVTTQAGVEYGAHGYQRKAWRRTWLHQWLVQHAAEYRFHALATEEWHWEFR
jgi:hypothetical protein